MTPNDFCTRYCSSGRQAALSPQGSTGIREDAEQLLLNVHVELVGLKDSILVALGGQAKEFSEGLKGIFIHLGNLVSFWRTTAGFMVNLPLQIPTGNGCVGACGTSVAGTTPWGAELHCSHAVWAGLQWRALT